MSLSAAAKRKAAVIVSIFETGKAGGNPATVAVLNDGAGISYGMFQATHKSGSLYAVVARFVEIASESELAQQLAAYLPILKQPAKRHVAAADAKLKSLLKQAGQTPEMKQAQQEVFEEKYMRPAVEACEGSGWTLPLSLAVVYDSLVHGSWARIRDRIPSADEKTWISRYVLARDRWLESIPRLANTDYRTDFFLEQIKAGNWNLDAPMSIVYNNGTKFKITEQMFALDDLPPEPTPAAPAKNLPEKEALATDLVSDLNQSAPAPAPTDPPVQVIDTKPPVVEVKPPSTSLTTKIAAAASAVTPVLTAAGLKVGHVELSTASIIAFGAVIIVGIVTGAWLWNASQNRRHEELKLSMQNLADQNKHNVIAAGSQV